MKTVLKVLLCYSRKVQSFGRTHTSRQAKLVYYPYFALGQSDWIPRGSGLSYGDAALPDVGVAVAVRSTSPAFVPGHEGRTCVRVSAGDTVASVTEWLATEGFELPVVPGAGGVTIGGALAADVHGKNQHQAGSFGCHVSSIGVLQGGTVVQIQPHTPTFPLVIGSMGTTGLIVDAQIEVRRRVSNAIRVQRHVGTGAAPLVERLESLKESHHYIVGWLDWTRSVRRGAIRWVIDAGNEETSVCSGAVSARGDREIAAPAAQFRIPLRRAFSPAPCVIKSLNSALFWRATHKQSYVVSKNNFFFPLERIVNWNCVIGRNGFFEYQFVVPIGHSVQVLSTVFDLIAKSREVPFFSGCKIFAKQQRYGTLSFCEPGVAVALDFVKTKKSEQLLNELDTVVAGSGGKIYLAKDARLSKANFRQMYPAIGEIEAYRLRMQNPPRSLMTQRLGIA